MAYAFIILTLVYAMMIIWFCIAYNRMTSFDIPKPQPKTSFSIIVPFRNEASNLGTLMTSLKQLEYPSELYEILMIDDDSEDDSVQIIQEQNGPLNVTVIPNQRHTKSPKKDAISLGVSQSKYDWIVTTDADCSVPKHWLNSFDSLIQNVQVEFIAAPVVFNRSKQFLGVFQILDMLSLQTVTAACFKLKQPILCNGANLAYAKSLFHEVNGFEGNEDISSGDDIFLMEKAFNLRPNSVHYLKSSDAIVDTNTQPTLASLIQQRIRWASKTSAYNRSFGKLVGLLVLLMNAAVVVAFMLLMTKGIDYHIAMSMLLIKMLVDVWCVYCSAKFMKRTAELVWFPISSLVYPLFTVYIAVRASISGYTWKHRRFNK